ncbi:hypothetical protein P175DRAFT_0559636 [Aspergillus ochraceoroseus IBT 24754]|uniref:Uncharacterized protein n=1 Tax=Aspergillus ochraceoroseus IBT 24754 TaxID=1392256 RepID=A0A2T5LR99_9EURO|nr:uncharacterized protein P175DRAFT_0559636 [Aspergillus ochraceoroseus IBT 24754]PTU18812.1 hypothetical protein P175DRAFT_0559636 [Aspergillus ochraceoroseus IBT 24754]
MAGNYPSQVLLSTANPRKKDQYEIEKIVDKHTIKVGRMRTPFTEYRKLIRDFESRPLPQPMEKRFSRVRAFGGQSSRYGGRIRLDTAFEEPATDFQKYLKVVDECTWAGPLLRGDPDRPDGFRAIQELELQEQVIALATTNGSVVKPKFLWCLHCFRTVVGGCSPMQDSIHVVKPDASSSTARVSSEQCPSAHVHSSTTVVAPVRPELGEIQAMAGGAAGVAACNMYSTFSAWGLALNEMEDDFLKKYGMVI